MYKRVLNIDKVLERKSVFIFGPRQTGKSTWLRGEFPEALYINLLSKPVYEDYLIRKNALASDIELVRKKQKVTVVVIDEIQKLPQLLDEVHNQIELDKSLRFILTGSSARKLKREGVNLLGGRASWRQFFPLTYKELQQELKTISDLERRILVGGLPSMYDSPEPFDDFDDYIQLYLSEEIRAEGFVRNYEAFHRFLKIAALSNARQINFTQIGRDSQIPPRTVHDYFQILEDTLIGFILPAFTETLSRKSMTSAKFYLFDTGLSNAIINRKSLNIGTPEFGDLFEQYIISEVRAYCSYNNLKAELSYWRSTSKIEVDLIIKTENQMIAIEVKSKSHLGSKEHKGLVALSEDYPQVKKIIVTPESRRAITENNIDIYPYDQFLDELWLGKILTGQA